jgi:hypothetical protein
MDKEAKAVNPLPQYFLHFVFAPKMMIRFPCFGKMTYAH